MQSRKPDFQHCCVFSLANHSFEKKKKLALQITDAPLTGRILSRRLCGDNARLNVSGCSISNTCPLTGFLLCVFCSLRHIFLEGSRGAFYHGELQPKSLDFPRRNLTDGLVALSLTASAFQDTQYPSQ